MGKLDGKVAVVTGGASGIGRGRRHLFASEGASVGIFDLDRAGAEKVAKKYLSKAGEPPWRPATSAARRTSRLGSAQ